MSELKDSFFMLFGKNIAFPTTPTQVSDADDCVIDAASDHNLSSPSDSGSAEHNNFISIDQQLNKKSSKDEQEVTYIDLETSSPCKTESDTQDKTLKKPDKIVSCPRCNSMDTKFCYYNNYNVKQPRHFCKNCQRYWTAGGTMRSVPVGAGRRKTKTSTASHYRHLMASEALQVARMNAANGSVLTFGSDSSQIQNGFHIADQRVVGGKDNGDDHSSGCGSSITASSSSDKVDTSGLQEATVKNGQVFPPQVPFFPGPPWHCAWNSTMHPAAFSPVSFYPAPAYWGCTVMGPWDMQHASPPSSVLGKHVRDEKPANESKPKTLRIDDPSEAERRSMWATLGGGLFHPFQHGDGKYQAVGASAALRANPAALSRSLSFQEST